MRQPRRLGFAHQSCSRRSRIGGHSPSYWLVAVCAACLAVGWGVAATSTFGQSRDRDGGIILLYGNRRVRIAVPRTTIPAPKGSTAQQEPAAGRELEPPPSSVIPKRKGTTDRGSISEGDERQDGPGSLPDNTVIDGWKPAVKSSRPLRDFRDTLPPLPHDSDPDWQPVRRPWNKVDPFDEVSPDVSSWSSSPGETDAEPWQAAPRTTRRTATFSSAGEAAESSRGPGSAGSTPDSVEASRVATPAPSPPQTDAPAAAAQAVGPLQSASRSNADSEWLKAGVVPLVGTVVGLLVGVLLLVVSLLLVIRRLVPKLEPTIRVEMSNSPFPVYFVHSGGLSGAPSGEWSGGGRWSPADQAMSKPQRNTAVVDLTEQPIPANIIGTTYEQQRLSDAERQRQLEQAILKQIFEENVELRDKLLDKKRAA